MIVSALVVIGLVVFFSCVPLRKKITIGWNPYWKKLARNPEFSPEEEAGVRGNMFISYTVFRENADIAWREKDPDPPEALFGDLPYGTVVLINTKHLAGFIGLQSRLSSHIVLVVGGDTISPSVDGYGSLLENPRILHVFLQNCDWDPDLITGKVTHIPVGLNFHKLDPASDNRSIDMGLPATPEVQQLTLLSVRDTVPSFRDKPCRAYANFHLNMDTFLRSKQSHKRALARRDALAALRKNRAVTFEKRQTPRNVVWTRHRDYSFEISPHGNGLDCHRTWEALILKSTPIVKTSSLDPLYEGLPVVIVNSWDEVTADNLARWKKEMEPLHRDDIHEKLYSNWWIKRFSSWKK